MSDGVGRAIGDQRDNEEKAFEKWKHLSRGEQRMKWAWHRFARDVAVAIERYAETVGNHHRERTDKLFAAMFGERGRGNQ